MSREVYRVPLDFDWPLDKVWDGFLSPARFVEDACPDCELGYAPVAQLWYNKWYGKVPFDPAETGSVPLTTKTPEVWAFAKRNCESAPGFYGGTSDAHIEREAQRLLSYWNSQWNHHLDQDDVDALIEGGRLWDFTRTWTKEDGWVELDPTPEVTPAMVNAWNITTMGHDSINCHVAVEARCKRLGEEVICPTCKGHGSIEAYPGQREEAEKWEATEPPTGEGWQLWETVSEGSPISPVFSTAEDLARWMSSPAYQWGVSNGSTLAYETALSFVKAGWAPSGVKVGGKMMTGEEFVGSAHE